MAKRKTIRANPLDSLIPDPERPLEHSSNRSVSPPAGRKAKPLAQPIQAQIKTADMPRSIEPQTPPQSTDLMHRIESLEQQSCYLGWLAGGAILLALLL
ncbi:MAG: hypothetical protein CV088_21800 [Nitrospira sp. LK70]|nr:hypothetical protein [Nitrospira sp. LK70]